MQHFVFKIIVLIGSLLILISCSSDLHSKQAPVLPGIFQTEEYLPLLENKRVGIVMNSSSRIDETLLVDTLEQLGVNIVRIFSPEHGFSGAKSAGELLEDDRYNGVPIRSLHGKNKKPDQKDLADLDLILFDLQDLGIRFYTYISTLHYVLESAAEADVPVIVLDRPHPFYNVIAGPVLNPDFRSFIGMHPVPILYGMTIGEYALMIKGEAFIEKANQLELQIIEIRNFSDSSEIVLDQPPSPNLPNHQAILNYPHLCFFEATTFSVGRGTDYPFELLGHPQLQVFDTTLIPRVREASKWPKYQDQKCKFVRVRSQKLEKYSSLDWSLLFEYNKWAKEQDLVFVDRPEHLDKLAGTDQLRRCLENEALCDAFLSRVEEDVYQFKKIRARYQLY